MTAEESRALEMLGWYQEQHRILRDRCDSLTARVRAAEARIAELEQIIHDMRIENSGQAAEIERLKKELNTN